MGHSTVGYGWRAILPGLLLFAVCIATAGERRYYFDAHDSERNLVQHSINGFFQDRTGFIWIATQGGLHRYDGYRYRLYEHSADDADSLPDSFVTAIAEDDRGGLWVGGRTGGVARLDPATGKVRTLAIPPDSADAQDRNAISALKFDPARGLWIASRAGIDLMDPQSGQRREIYRFAAGRKQAAHVSALSLSGDDTLWAATSAGLLRVAPGGDHTQPVATARIAVAYAVVIAQDGVHAATPEGLFRVEPEQDRAELVWPDPANPVAVSNHDVRDVVEDAQGKFWLAIFGEGLAVYDPASRHTEWLRSDRNLPGSLPEQFEAHLFLDRSGLLWVGGGNRGFATTDPVGSKFRLLVDTDPVQAQSSTGNYVRALFEDAHQRLWIGTENGELKRYDPASGQFDRFTEALLGALGAVPRPRNMHVTSLSDAGDGRLWVAAGSNVFLLDTDARKASLLQVDATRRDSSVEDGRAPTATQVVFAARDRSLWLGSSETGLAHGWPQQNRWEFFRHRDGRDDSLAHDDVLSVFEDRDRRIWIGTAGGLSLYAPPAQTLRSFRHIEADPNSLSNSFVHTLYQGRDGNLWVGTHGGLNRADLNADGSVHFTHYPGPDGLANATIYSILDDRNGDLWLGTNQGIQHFERKLATLRAFSLHDGLQGMEFNTGVAQRLANGDLAFGGTDGVNLFNPEAIRYASFMPPAVITSVQVGDATNSTWLPRAQGLRVQQAERVLRFEFAALDYAAPTQNRFAYQLQGFDDAWIQAGTRHDATYTNLPAGNYALRVRVSNRDGIWSDQIATLPVSIMAPWWDSRAMQLVYAVAAIILLLLVWRALRLRRRRELRHHTELERRDERFRMALWGSGDEFWDLDLRTQAMHRIGADQSFGGNYEQTIPDEKWLREMTHPDDFPLLMQRRLDCLEGRAEIFESEHRMRASNGEWVWRLSRGKVVERDPDGKPLRACGTARNVTETHLADRQQRIAAEVINSMTEAVFVTDLEFRCVSVNHAFTRMTGYSEAEMLGLSATSLHSAQQSTEAYRAMRADYVRNGHWRGEVWQRRKNGEEYLSWLEVSAVNDARGVRSHYVSVMTDITDRKRAEQELRYLANYDTVTGLPNRTLLIERISRAIERARRDGMRVAVLFLDLDRFKHINDSMGHLTGDLMLKAVGERLRASVSEADTVARIGGDEFTLVIDGLHDVAQAEVVAQKVIQTLSEPLDLDGARAMGITPSIGISLFPDHAQGPMDLLKFADAAMYQAKEQGRNTYMLYAPSMDATARRLANTASALRLAIERNELHVVYQPKLSLPDGRVSGVETLLRWQSDELGEIRPEHFIPLAEQTGIIVELGEFVLRSACAQLRQWRGQGFDISMAINVSVVQLLRGGLPARLHSLIEENAIDAGKLQLELTESMLMARADQTLGMLDELKALGLSLAIDDFGTGYSSLSYLKRLPVDTLKIDRTFVGDICTDPGDKAITATIISMAHSLGLHVVAEGVETVEQFECLRTQGCDEIQGDWFSPPLSAETCTKFLHSFAPPAMRAAAG